MLHKADSDRSALTLGLYTGTGEEVARTMGDSFRKTIRLQGKSKEEG